MSKALQLFQQAYLLHQQGRLSDAEALYLKALNLTPKNADLLRMLGMLYLQQGSWQKGAQQTEASLKVNPNQPEALNNLGYALQNLNRFDEALVCYERAIGLNRGYAGAWYNRGNVLLSMQRYDESIASYRQALKIRPTHPDSWVNLGKALKLIKRYDEACSSYRQALALVPNHAIAYNNLGNALNELKRHDEALACFEKAINLVPNYADAYYNAALVLQTVKRHDDAVSYYRKAIALQPDYAEAYLKMGVVYQELGKHDEALSWLDRAIALKPNGADAYVSKGGLLVELGRMSDAEAALERSLELAPDEAAPLIGLLSLKRSKRGEPFFDRLEAHYGRREKLPVEKQVDMCFAMGSALEHSGEYDESFAAYQEANRLYFHDHPYDEAEDVGYVENTCNFFSDEMFSKYSAAADALPSECDQRVPIFIVGMPRSGTTLIEQILASHSDLYGAGELATLSELVKKVELLPPGAPNWESSVLALRELGRQYLDSVWKLVPGARFITDKMPHNFKYIGLIPLMFPNAKIIHSLRDPMDTCFSCYALLFKEGHEYSYDMQMLGRHYQRYRKLMAHWCSILPADRMLEIRYEDNVADLEHQARRLLDYLGLPWDSACLKFYQNRRSVSTASVTQVRKPIYSSSVARWKRYEKHLEPLLEIVAGDDAYRNTDVR